MTLHELLHGMSFKRLMGLIESRSKRLVREQEAMERDRANGR